MNGKMPKMKTEKSKSAASPPSKSRKGINPVQHSEGKAAPKAQRKPAKRKPAKRKK